MRISRPCPSCGFINTSEARRCLKCGAALREEDVSALLARPRWRNLEGGRGGGAARFLERAGAGLRLALDRLREAAFPREVEPDYQHRRPWVAAWLALLPGCGALCNGRPRRALALGAVYLALLAFAALTLRKPWSNWVLLTWLVWVFFCFNDAFTYTLRRNGQFWTYRHSLAAFSYLFFAIGVCASLGQFLFSPVFTLVWIRDDVLEPGLAARERVLVWKASHWLREPRRGEIVFYDPPRYEIDLPQSPETAARDADLVNRPMLTKYQLLDAIETRKYVIDESRSFGRVIGVGGDTVERRDGGPILLNGRPLAPEAYPLVPDGCPREFHIEVPPGKFCILISHFSKETVMRMGISLGGVSPSPGAQGVNLIGWDKACVVDPEAISGRALAVYHPSPNRRLLPIPR